jgi:soluble lytic murein transglycosylase-like protein
VAEALIAAGMPDWARARLRGLSDTKGDRATSIALAWLLVEAEDYAGARKLACPWKDDRAALEACVVRPHASAVTSIAGQYGLNPLLPYAIMHAESGFDPSVTSPAGARGLMQLMPELAARLAAPSMPGFEPNELYRAGVNARLGTTELGLLSRRWERISVQPSLPLVIAGYNGGGEAVERWLGTYARPPEPGARLPPGLPPHLRGRLTISARAAPTAGARALRRGGGQAGAPRSGAAAGPARARRRS